MKKALKLLNSGTLLFVLVIFPCAPLFAQQAEFIWSENDYNGSRIVISEYENGSWQAGESVFQDRNLNILPTLGENSRGQKLAIWSTVSGDRSILKYSIKRGKSWQKPQVLTDTLFTNLAPVIVFDKNDVCWVFWSANDGDDDDDIYASRFENARWSEPKRVNQDNDVPDILPEAGLDDAGNVWVSWQTLADSGYVEMSKSFEAKTFSRMLSNRSISVQQIQQLKMRSNLENQIQPPAAFKSRSISRGSFYFPGDKKRPSKTVQQGS